MDRPIGVLFVCLGSICRSPMAEAAFRHLVNERGLQQRFRIDSAGTGSWHVGSSPHPETLEQLRLAGVDAGQQRARQVVAADLEAFDYVVAMDSDNLRGLHELGSRDEVHAELSLLLEHAEEAPELDVPDPYYAGGYDRVYELVHAGCLGLLRRICRQEGLPAE